MPSAAFDSGSSDWSMNNGAVDPAFKRNYKSLIALLKGLYRH